MADILEVIATGSYRNQDNLRSRSEQIVKPSGSGGHGGEAAVNGQTASALWSNYGACDKIHKVGDW